MDPEESARVCGPVAGDMAMALATRPAYVLYTAYGFDAMASHLGSAEASQAGHVLASALETAPTDWIRLHIASSLARLAIRMDRTQARQMHQLLARVLTDALKAASELDDSDGSARHVLSMLASHMEALDAAAFFSSALDFETDQRAPNPEPTDSIMIGRTRNQFVVTPLLVDGFMTTITRLGAVDRGRICARLRSFYSPESAEVTVLNGAIDWSRHFCELQPR